MKFEVELAALVELTEAAQEYSDVAGPAIADAFDFDRGDGKPTPQTGVLAGAVKTSRSETFDDIWDETRKGRFQ